MIIPVLYIPSFYGDVRLERIDDKSTRVIVAKATPAEAAALRDLAEYAVKKKWLEDTSKAVFDEGSFVLGAELKKVHGRIAKALKPGRQIVTVVKFEDGKMEEIASTVERSASTPVVEQVTSTVEKAAKAMGSRASQRSSRGRVAEAAAAVARPNLGCPAPDFAAAELRANRVLEVFLDDEQTEDFRKHNRFVTVGAATGHRLLITSRHAKDTLAKYHRSLFDLDDDKPLCVHDWDVPPAEEMLALHLLANVPQHELFMRRLEEESV